MGFLPGSEPESTFTPSPATNGAVKPGLRQFRADFETSTFIGRGVSLDLRPDAISFDHQTAFAFGPAAIGDTSQGAYQRAWRVTVHDMGVYVASADAGNADWLDDELLFVFTGAGIREVDVAFEQAARPVVVAERATGPDSSSEVWLYWYKPSAADFVFERICAGRTPRIILDNPTVLTESDIDVFYLNAAQTLAYRVQREVYAIEHETSFAGNSNTFLEEVFVSMDNRMVCTFSQRNPVTGTYQVKRLESTLLPTVDDGRDSRLSADVDVLDGAIHLVVLTPVASPESLFLPISLRSGTLAASILYYPGDTDPTGESPFFANDPESISGMLSIIGGTLVAPLILHSLYDVDRVTASHLELRSGGSLTVIVLLYMAYDVEAVSASWSPRSGILE